MADIKEVIDMMVADGRPESEIVALIDRYNKDQAEAKTQTKVETQLDFADELEPETVVEQGGYKYKFDISKDNKPIYYTKKKDDKNWTVVDPELSEENFITNPAYVSIGQEFGHFKEDVFDREAYFKQPKVEEKT